MQSPLTKREKKHAKNDNWLGLGFVFIPGVPKATVGFLASLLVHFCTGNSTRAPL